jgi:hypothetical protein
MKNLLTVVALLVGSSALAMPGPLINGNQINPQSAISISTLSVTGAQGLSVTGQETVGSTLTVAGSTASVGGSEFSVQHGTVTTSGRVTAPSFLGVSGATETTNASMTGVGTAASPLGVASSSVAVLNASGFVQNFNLDGSSVTKLNASGLVPNVLLDGSSVTKQGNTFNAASKLVQLNASSQYPALDGSLITNITGFVKATDTTTFSGANTFTGQISISSTVAFSKYAVSAGATSSVAGAWYADWVPKAEIQFNPGTPPTVNFSIGITSVTRVATGEYRLSFVTPFANTNYRTYCAGARSNASGSNVCVCFPGGIMATSSVEVMCGNASLVLVDCFEMHCFIYGTQ